jgi:DNA-binding HxlR family transcriptional regulator
MNTRSYNQFCALAAALDVVGERWTLLIIRELLPGPRRFKDLIEGLPGVSTNLLSERLKALEQDGLLCRRILPPPAGSAVYELTAAGQALEPAVLALGQWGSRRLPTSLEGVAPPSLGALTLALKAFFHPTAAQGLDETYELRFGSEALQVRLHAGALQAQHGTARQPVAVFHTDLPTFLGLFTGRLDPGQALAAGLVRVEGDPDALGRFLCCCHVPVPTT